MRTLMAGLGGVMAYEYRMQVRRGALWLTMGGFALALLALTLGSTTWHTYSRERSALLSFADVASLVMLLLPVAVGLLLADRLPRDRTTQVLEVLDTLPTATGTRLVGKYLGSTLATLTPMVGLYLAGIGYVLALRGRDFAAFPLAVLPLAAIILPGCLFVAAFSVAVPSLLWPPLYQFLFVGYWFWGNLLLLASLPTLNGTLLTADGDYMLVAFFGGDGAAVHRASVGQGVASMVWLLGLGTLALVGAWGWHRWQRART